MHSMQRNALFEVSWEVCNKVGGIYAVVSTKALQAQETFGENYYLLGPDLVYNAEFEETTEACWDILRPALMMRNLTCRFGRWNIPGRPKAILVGFKDRYNQSQLLAELWVRYGVDSLTGGWDYVEPVMFSTACGEVIATAYQTLLAPEGKGAVAQFHEWMCGAGLLAVKRLAPQIGTVFTTHATMLGRSLAGTGVDIYQQMRQINPRREAAAHNITAKCSMETVSAREADCFTTVSNITADEASSFLGRAPDIVTPNGLDLRVIPDFTQNRAEPERCRQKLFKAVNLLLRHDLPPQTRIMVISGRYEYHNKGIDVFLDALVGVSQALQQSQTHVLALCTVMGGHSGINPMAVEGDPSAVSDQGGENVWISSHHVHNLPHDPIITACNRLGLTNQPGNHVQVVFVPSLLDGKDGFLDMTYEEVLAACDLGVFPSWYEPWGYTPQESAAHSVPTVTTDLSGFGIWARDIQEKIGGVSGVQVLPRRQTSYADTVNMLRKILLDTAACSTEDLNIKRVAVRCLAGYCDWGAFFPFYVEAYQTALDNASERDSSQDSEALSGNLNRLLSGASSTTPNLHTVTAVASLPASLARLRELAYNLWWSWNPDAWILFSSIDPANWEKTNHNPVRMIEEISATRLGSLTEDPGYMNRYRQVMEHFDAYMSEKAKAVSQDLSPEHPVAYFSAEYGLNESLPIYSGGLGVLSGDHLKSSSDLNLPLVGIGLLYKNGYFRQRIGKDRMQIAEYPENDFSLLPVERVKDSKGELLTVRLDLPGRQLTAQVWQVRVGRIVLYLMDTDIAQNTEDDRRITARLYEADRDIRLRQEILLGMGGVRVLEALEITPSLYHMNEGHSAFLVLERARDLMLRHGLDFASAGLAVRDSCQFTTHTPVDAGNERFSLELIERYFSQYAQSVGLSMQDFYRLGRAEDASRNQFEMTALALRYSCGANGVSKLHGDVSRHMWRQGWKGVPVSEVPIGYVTNGVHVPSYAGDAMRMILDQHLGDGWALLPPESPVWERISDIPDEILWSVRQHQKTRLLDRIRKQLPASFEKYNIPRPMQKEIMSRLTPNALVIGFARRFAPYKRATLLFADTDRLERILSNVDRPVIFVFSGKAHPADTQGSELIQSVLHMSHDPRFAGRVFFIEDYSLAVSRIMVQGCDVWLNTPRRPYEASGTSGQKVSVNGGLNLSVSDGWWCEGYYGPGMESTTGTSSWSSSGAQHTTVSANNLTSRDSWNYQNGWTIGPVWDTPHFENDQDDYADAESLYTLLEDSVLPLYFNRDIDDVPHKWLGFVKNAMMTLISSFSSNRMLRDYVKDYYMPCAQRNVLAQANDFALPKRLSHWKRDVSGRFETMRIERTRIEGMDEDSLICGRPLRITVRVIPGEMQLEELVAQFVIGPGNGSDFSSDPDVIELKGRRSGDGVYFFTGSYTATRNGTYVYGVRIMPIVEGLASPLDSRQVVWG